MPGERSCSASSHSSNDAWSGNRCTGRSEGALTSSSCFTRGGVGYPPAVDRERMPGSSALWLVRHGESVGNVADAEAHAQGAGRLQLDVRDPDVPLSETGCSQAPALGRWRAALPVEQRPTAVLSSPFTRALTTARLAAEPVGLRVRIDERLRE